MQSAGALEPRECRNTLTEQELAHSSRASVTQVETKRRGVGLVRRLVEQVDTTLRGNGVDNQFSYARAGTLTDSMNVKPDVCRLPSSSHAGLSGLILHLIYAPEKPLVSKCLILGFGTVETLGVHEESDTTSQVCIRLGTRGWNGRCVWLGPGVMVRLEVST